MKSPLQKSWPMFIILIFFAFQLGVLLWPSAGQWLSLTALLLGVGLAIVLTLRPEWQRYRRGRIDRKQLARRLFVSLTGLLLSLAAAMLVSRWVGGLAGQAAITASGQAWLGVLAGMLGGFAAGFAAVWLARLLWKKLSSRRVAAAADPELPA